jgi:AcrR family transcriptional regulator
MPSDPALAISSDQAPSQENNLPTSKRDALLRAALELFSERTFGATPVPEIAARAQVGTGTVYRHFASKEDLANHVYRACKQTMIESVQDQLAGGGSVKERFLRIWNALASNAAADPKALRFLEMQHHEEYLDEESRSVSDAAFEASVNLIREGQASGLVCNENPTVLISLAWGAFVGLFKEATLGRYQLTEEKVALAGELAWRMIAV